jgi:hypothetical protein
MPRISNRIIRLYLHLAGFPASQIRYLAGYRIRLAGYRYPVQDTENSQIFGLTEYPTVYLVSGFQISRISGQISIRYIIAMRRSFDIINFKKQK